MSALIYDTEWWREKDSNLRRLSQQIYSLPPLTARESLPMSQTRDFLTKQGICQPTNPLDLARSAVIYQISLISTEN